MNSDWFFLSHRLNVGRAARDQGFEVFVATIDTGKAERIRQEGFTFIPLPMSHHGTNPLAEIRVIHFFIKLYRQLRPDLVHHVTIKPVLYGSLAARLAGRIPTANAISGLGFVFGDSMQARLLRPLVRTLYRSVLNQRRSRTIFQNPDDLDLFVTSRLIHKNQAVLIRGSGVDCAKFAPRPEPKEGLVVVLASRMLWDKGISDFVEAAKLLGADYPHGRFILVGMTDSGNPGAVPEERLLSWVRQGVVEWWGHRADMPAVLAGANIVVLPSVYREGVPKVLLEAAASGRAIITTDVPGCREIVRHGVNGLLVPPREPRSLAAAVRTLAEDAELRAKYGDAGREIAIHEFTADDVAERHLQLYFELLSA